MFPMGRTEHFNDGATNHAALEAEWDQSFSALKAAGLEHDADHPIAARYRAASTAVNHSNRKRDYGIATGKIPSR